MPLDTETWSLRYSSNTSDLFADFYTPALANSVIYRRAAAYFRSTVLRLSFSCWEDFVARGGKALIACAPEITEEDTRAIQLGEDAAPRIAACIEAAIEEFSDGGAVDHLTLLAALIATRNLEIKFIVPTTGLFHEKVGLFEDGQGNSLSFTGSANETWRAWSPDGNHESFDVFKSWGTDSNRVELHKRYLESLWAGQQPGLAVHSLTEALRNQLLRFAPEDPREFLKSHDASLRSSEIPVPNSSSDPLTNKSDLPLLDYQRECVDNWELHQRRGIITFATGAGKTFTALEALRRWVADGRSAIVLVPSILLLEQWSREIRAHLSSDVKLTLAGDGNETWRPGGVLQTILARQATGRGRIVLATLQTASAPTFFERLLRCDAQNLLVVCDEVHNIGSSSYLKIMDIESSARLGLSATPNRYGDPDGSARIRAYFGEDLQPTIGIADAIRMDRLCPYDYFVHEVDLNDEEQTRYVELSARIARIVGRDRETSGDTPSQELKHLLLRRARIVKEAVAKPSLAASIVASNWTDGDRWLVYCENVRLLQATMAEIRTRGIPCDEYHNRMPGDRAATLRRFDAHGGVLAAVRCLDEGVDIPSITHAVIGSSSKNPRQFIQRRGRVLRSSPATGKVRAVVHDLMVMPSGITEASKNVFLGAILDEIVRGLSFADDADNVSGRDTLRQLIDRYGIDEDTIVKRRTHGEEEKS